MFLKDLLINCLILVLFLLFAACELLNPREELPIYLNLGSAQIGDPISINFQYSEGIKDIWLYRNNEFLGTYKLGSVVPIYPSETKNFLIAGGIFQDGLSAFRAPYPFWQQDEIIIDVPALDTFYLSHAFRYLPDSALVIPIEESFEASDFILQSVNSRADDVSLQRTRERAFKGDFSAKATFSSQSSNLVVQSNGFFLLPRGRNNDIYFEISYLNDVAFNVGLNYVSSSGSGNLNNEIFFRSENKWNRAFIHLWPLVANSPEGSLYQIEIRANGNGNAGELFLDNIRLVYFRNN